MNAIVSEVHKKRIEEIMGSMECPKDFECFRSGFNDLCKVKDVGMESLVVCLGKNPQNCKFSAFFGPSSFCQCPLRVYIAKHLGR